MVVTLSVLLCLNGQCMTRSVIDSERAPEMTMMSCLTQGQPSVAQYVTENFPGAQVKKWRCQFGNEKLAEKPDL